MARNLAEIESEIADVPLFELLERYRACSSSRHAWRRLDAPELTAGEASWCAWCLRIKTPSFEGWLARLPELSDPAAHDGQEPRDPSRTMPV